MIARLEFLFIAFACLGACSKKTGEESEQQPAAKGKSSRNSGGRFSKYVLDQPPKIPNKLDVEFDGKVELLGYKVDPSGIIPGDKNVTLTLYWRTKEKLDNKWKLATHVLDASGGRVVDLYNKSPIRAGKRGRPALRLSRWEPGKVYVDELKFNLPAELRSNEVRVVAGIYATESERMKVTKGDKQGPELVSIGTLRVSLDGKSKGDWVPSVVLEKLEPSVEIKVDGALSEPAWATAPVLGPFTDAKGGGKGDSKIKGSARLLWNERALYVACEIEDQDVVGGFPAGAKDAALRSKDAFQLMIDPDGDGDGKDYYEIQINPQNLVFDSRFDKYEENKDDPNSPAGQKTWSSNVGSAVVVNGTIDKSDDKDKGYTVEAAIPWKSLSKAKQTPPALGDTWRLNLYAVEQGAGSAWSPFLSEGNFHTASRFGKVRFVQKGFAAPGSSATAGPASSGSAPKPKAAGSSAVTAPPKASAAP